MNNIVANVGTGIAVDNTCGTTVVGATLYQGNGVNTTGPIGAGSFPITLQPTDPLFVDAADMNFYLMEGSQAIDTSINSLPDRTAMISVDQPLGIGLSPIIAPAYDKLGQLRIPDPNDQSPPGYGQNVYIDRGAIQRADFIGPNATLFEDSTQLPIDATVTGQVVTEIDVQLADAGTGVDPLSVTSGNVQVFSSARPSTPLNAGTDYLFSYDPSADMIRLTAGSGVWADSCTYTIVLNNSATGIRDIADNPLQPNRANNTTTFTITLQGLTFGCARCTWTLPPRTIPGHTISTTVLPQGASAIINPTVYLGSAVPTAAANAQISTDCTGDPNDEGITFVGGNTLVSPASGSPGVETIVVNASCAGYLDGWVDWDQNGVWDLTTDSLGQNEQLTFTNTSGNSASTILLHAGNNTLTFTVPSGLANTGDFNTYVRFRFSTSGTLVGGGPMLPYGESANGQIEDYQLSVIPPPAEIQGTVYDDLNDSGVPNASDPGLAGVIVYVDANGDGQDDPGDPYATTAANGTFTLQNLAPGNYTIREVLPAGWYETEPTVPLGSTTGSYVFSSATGNALTGGETVTGVNFGNFDMRPKVTVSPAATQANPTNKIPIDFTVVFSELVTGFTSSGVTLGGTAPGTLTDTVTAVAGTGGTTYTVAVSGMTGPGTVTAAIPGAVAEDSSGDPNAPSPNAASVTYDNTSPTVEHHPHGRAG